MVGGMSASYGMWEEVAAEEEARRDHEIDQDETHITDLQQFAEEQLLGLIQRIFLSGWPRPMHQVIFAGAGEDAGSAEVSLRVAEALANQTAARVCLVDNEAGAASNPHSEYGGGRADNGNTPESAGVVRSSSLQLKSNLWVVPAEIWRAESSATLPWMRRRLGELRREFDYAVIHAPPVGTSGEAETLARLTDGLILVLEAHRTRRVLAHVARRKLQAANVHVLGAVLSGRTFPIPERLYRRF
jgi:hypothetical protein